MYLFVYCRKVAAAVLYVMNAVVVNTFVEPKWLYAVPLYHFLSNTVKPFTRPSEHGSTAHQKHDWWGIADLHRLVSEFKWKQRTNM